MLHDDNRPFLHALPTKVFKSFNSPSTTLSGIELRHMLRKQKKNKYSNNKNIFEQFYYLVVYLYSKKFN